MVQKEQGGQQFLEFYHVRIGHDGDLRADKTDARTCSQRLHSVAKRFSLFNTF